MTLLKCSGLNLLMTRAAALHTIRKQNAKVPNGEVRTRRPPKNFDFKNQG